MTLAFSKKINNRDTLFVEKIWECLLHDKAIENITIEQYTDYLSSHLNKYGLGFGGAGLSLLPKLHTIREDVNDRWKPGNDIHFVINNRTKDRFQFAPIVKCISTQIIQIKYEFPNNLEWLPSVFVDGALLDIKQVYKLAINDGFNSVNDFFAYFNTDFTGKIIHWTNLRY